jgi:hypothetical protein
MQLFLTAFARLVPLGGTALLLAAVSLDFEWTRHLPALAFLIVVTLAFRKYQIPVTKYSALNLLCIVATGGALVTGPTTAALAMFLGVIAGDLMLLRKEINAAWINAGRETLALIASYGFFAWSAAALGARGGEATGADFIPAMALFLLAHFVISRGLLYFSLILRGKLLADERSLILRYEILTYGAGSAAVATIVGALQILGWLGTIIVAFVLIFAGLLLKRIIEESIAAEELNTILAMEQVVSSDRGLGDAILQIQALAHRLIDWRELRITRIDSGRQLLAYVAGQGLLSPPHSTARTFVSSRSRRASRSSSGTRRAISACSTSDRLRVHP